MSDEYTVEEQAAYDEAYLRSVCVQDDNRIGALDAPAEAALDRIHAHIKSLTAERDALYKALRDLVMEPASYTQAAAYEVLVATCPKAEEAMSDE